MSKLFVALCLTSLEISILGGQLFAGHLDAGRGIQRLTLESRDEAVECGKSGADCAIKPYRLCSTNIGQRYLAFLATPFSRVASSIFEMSKKRERLRAMSPGAANGWGVGIYISPSENLDHADSIQNVVIRREGHTIQPLTTTIAPVHYTTRTGVKKQLWKGFFAFPMDSFAPTADITVVLIGGTGEVTCTLDSLKLSTLR
jgi:hypothetical protein